MDEEIEMMSSMLAQLVVDDEVDDFFAYAKKKAEKDGMDSEFFEFLDDLKRIAEEGKELVGGDNEKPWVTIQTTLSDVTGRDCFVFKGDGTVAIENSMMSRSEEESAVDYAPINLEKMNEALEPVGVKLEFIEALHLRIDFDGLQNFVRFRVVEI